MGTGVGTGVGLGLGVGVWAAIETEKEKKREVRNDSSNEIGGLGIAISCLYEERVSMSEH